MPMKFRDSKNALAALALVALATSEAPARADDTAAEIRALKEQFKLLQPLKERMKARMGYFSAT